jgi:hypothetical protein
MDVSGQQQPLSLRAAKFAEITTTTISTQNQAGVDNEEADGLMFDTLLLGGRSLCNFALDGDSSEMLAREVICVCVIVHVCMCAFDDAEKVLNIFTEIAMHTYVHVHTHTYTYI